MVISLKNCRLSQEIISQRKCFAKVILKAVFPIAVGPIMVIRYFKINFCYIDDGVLARMAMESFLRKNKSFCWTKQRPEEARFASYKNCFFDKNL